MKANVRVDPISNMYTYVPKRNTHIGFRLNVGNIFRYLFKFTFVKIPMDVVYYIVLIKRITISILNIC